jgi:hypothetical protein
MEGADLRVCTDGSAFALGYRAPLFQGTRREGRFHYIIRLALDGMATVSCHGWSGIEVGKACTWMGPDSAPKVDEMLQFVRAAETRYS